MVGVQEQTRAERAAAFPLGEQDQDAAVPTRSLMHEVLADTQAGTRLLHDQLTAQLAALQRQEENLIDLAADGQLPTEGVRTRLTRIATEKAALQARLSDTGDHLADAAGVLDAQLQLLTAPDELYAQLTDHGRRLLNQAVLDQILIDAVPDPADPAWDQITASGQTWHSDVHDLIDYTGVHRDTPTGPTGPTASHTGTEDHQNTRSPSQATGSVHGPAPHRAGQGFA